MLCRFHEAVFVVEAGVVGGEVAHLSLDDGMAAVFDMDRMDWILLFIDQILIEEL